MKKKYMNKMILCITLIGYIGLLILLLTMNIILLHNNQEDRKKSITGQLEKYTVQVKADADALNNYLYSIYTDNDNYSALVNHHSDTDDYVNAYELNNTLGLYQMTNTYLDGYFILYNGGEQILYKVKPEAVPRADCDHIKEVAGNYIGQKNGYSRMTIRIGEDHSYMMIIYQQRDVQLVGIYSLWNRCEQLKKSLGNNAQVTLWRTDDYSGENKRLDEELDLSALDSSGSQTLIKRQNGREIFGQKIADTNIWTVYSQKHSIQNYFSLTQIFLLAVTLISVAGAVWIYKFIIKIMVRPMYKLVDVMEKMQMHSIEEIPSMELPFYEMELMNTTLKDMVEEIKNQKMYYYEEKLVRQEAELKFLQLQLKPHFFLNCLKTLNVMAVDSGMTEMQNLILKIAEHLRYFLQIEKKTIALREEINFTQNYVALQNLLTNREISCSVEMEENLEEWIVPILCIQTFVENSIKYARTSQHTNAVMIHIMINRLTLEDGDRIDIMVMDSGQGYPDELLAHINERYSYDGDSVGINNMKRRCDILYGNQAEYSFYNMDGAVSELIFPRN